MGQIARKKNITGQRGTPQRQSGELALEGDGQTVSLS